MKSIIFGTTNEAKIKQIGGVLIPHGIEVSGLSQEDTIDILEDGKTAVENARKKALTYAKAIGQPVFSMDNALYLDGLKPDEQPALHVRRLKGYSSRPTDDEMVEYYSKLIGNLGEKINGYWEYGICIASPDGKYKETIVRAPRIFVSKRSNVVQKGYPLESLQIEPRSGRYMSELTQQESDKFWQKTIGEPVLKFVQSVNF
jgi:XTP/dITP diphosphohydrolase